MAIYWSGNLTLKSPTAYQLRVYFTYTGPRSDTLMENDEPDECVAEYATQPMIGVNNQLTKIYVQAFAEGDFRTLRSYTLAQTSQSLNAGSKTLPRNLLLEVVERGKNNAQLRKTTFSYDASNVNQVWLKTVDNAWGGSVHYSYGDYQVSCNRDYACRNGYGLRRYPVAATVAYNGVVGQARGSVRTEYLYTVTLDANGQPTASRSGAVADDGAFLGFQEVHVTHFAANSGDPNAALKWERLVSVSGVTVDLDNPDPRRGRLEQHEVWSKAEGLGGVRLQKTETVWQAYWFLNGAWSTTPTKDSRQDSTGVYPPTWIRQEQQVVTVYSGGGSVSNFTRQWYEDWAQGGYQYGNPTLVEEWADGVKLRSTRTDYRPNVAAHIVSLPARVRMYNGSGACVSEARMIYDHWETNTSFLWPPSKGLLTEREQALTSCSDFEFVAQNDPQWQVERFVYDLYGNQLTHYQAADSAGSPNRWTHTEYDAVYHLFPVKRYNAAQPDLAEQASYYGVNATSAGEWKGWDDPFYYWGAMAEWCDVNDVCVRQAYDSHGRRTLRWDNVPAGTTWANTPSASASVRWDYRDPFNYPNWHDVTVSEWHAPFCAGNLLRRHYDGFGQLTQEQRPGQGWSTNALSCGGSATPPEVDVDYLYDGLGRQYAASVPHPAGGDWINRAANWDYGVTLTEYDALGRVMQTTAPNGEVTTTSYIGRQTKVMGVGRDGYYNKTLGWTETDGLGNLVAVRSGSYTGVEVTKVTLRYDALGNLLEVTHADSGKTTTMGYDLAGRKLWMDDPDLGKWYYNYYRSGELRRQVDACGNVIEMTYDALGRLTQETATPGEGCKESRVTTAATTTYYAYNSRGQLAAVSHSGGTYFKELTYNAKGLLASEKVALEWVGGVPKFYTTSYGYDAYGRPISTTYPDNDVVKLTNYDSNGRPTKLTSTLGGVTTILVDNVVYDAAGRLTQARYGGGGGAWVTHNYYPWTGVDGNANGRYRGLASGEVRGEDDIISTAYGYDSYGNPVAYESEQGRVRQDNTYFNYDGQNRLRKGFGESFVWQARGAVDSKTLTSGTTVVTTTYGYDPVHIHAVAKVNGVDQYSYDLNGSMTARTTAAGAVQTLLWDSHNRLAQVTGGGANERYVYDESGTRIRKTTGAGTATTNTDYPFPGYEQTSSGAVTKHYSFGGVAVAVRSSSGISLLYQDGVQSTVYTTDLSGSVTSARGYYVFGATRKSTGTIHTNRRYTGQREDATGLYYYGARYYDPQIGQFISPDTIVPDPARLIDYNRYLYARGNPVKYNDPSGHQAACMADSNNNITCNPEAVTGGHTQTIQTPIVIPNSITTNPQTGTPAKALVRTIVQAGVPTVIGIEGGTNGSSGIILNGTVATSVQGLFNWYSGEITVLANYSGGMRISTPEGGNIALYAGPVTITGVSNNQLMLPGASATVSADVALDEWGKAGFLKSKTMAFNFQDSNGNGTFELSQGEGVILSSPIIDPVFNTPIVADHQGVQLSANLIPNFVDAGVSGSVNDSQVINTIVDPNVKTRN